MPATSNGARMHDVSAMEDPYLAAGSVPAEISAFHVAELEAFAAMIKQRRPDAWARVEALQRSCRELSPATVAGLKKSELELEPG